MSNPMNRTDTALKDEVKSLIVRCARLKVAPASLGDDQPLFDEKGGLGLDSIDLLEVVVNIEKAYGVTIQDRETGQRVLRSVATIVEFIRKSGKMA